eukprot:gene17585-20981_t
MPAGLRVKQLAVVPNLKMPAFDKKIKETTITMRKLQYCLVLIGLSFSLKTSAQNGFSGKLQVDYVPFSNYVRPVDSLKTGSTSNFKRIQASFSIPLSTKMHELGRPVIWALGLDGSYAQMTNRNYTEKIFPEEMLNAQIGLMHSRPIGKTWSIMAMASVGIYTDMEKISSDDVLAQGGVLFIKHFNPRLAFGFGPVLTNAFGTPMVLPGLYFDWVTQGKYKLHINFPQGMEFGVKMSDVISLNAVVELSGMTAEVNRENKSMILGYQQIIAGLRPEFKISKSLTFQLTAGTTLVRSFSLTDRKISAIFKQKDHADPRFTTAAYGSAALKWNFSKK